MDIYEKYKNNEVVANLTNEFKIKLDQYKVYDQKSSNTCWIYAAFNTIKRDIANILEISEKDMDFSVNYISFYDRIEKLNKLYDEIINNNYEISNIKYLLFHYINTCGEFNSFKYLVNKYGVVFERQMPMNDNSYKPGDIDNLLSQKVLADIEELLKQKKFNQNLQKLKETYMQENYKILVDIYGQPPKETIIKDIKLPTKVFFDKHIKNIVNEYISTCHIESWEYGKSYDLSFLDKKIDNEKYLNLELQNIKQAIVKSLKDNRPVWFGCSFRYMSGSYTNTDGILDDGLYTFDQLGIKKLPKRLAEKFNMLDYSHAMVFTGYDNKNKIVKWQVLNTFGEENNKKGYLVMSDNFFDSSVFMFAIHKKYLS